jgi:hypothetical protein
MECIGVAEMRSPRAKRSRPSPAGDGVHTIALRRQLAWAEDFARAGDLASALDALGDAGALGQEIGRPLAGADVGWL